MPCPAACATSSRLTRRTYLAELPSLVEEITPGTIAVQVRTMPLVEVEQAWPAKEVPGERIVLVPQQDE
jgi:hypothetical protein